jgi:hypothetical protein
MGAAPVWSRHAAAPAPESASRQLTLLELVEALCEETEDDREVVLAVVDLLRAGRVRLTGTFRGASLSV